MNEAFLNFLKYFGFIIVGYLLGSVLFSYLIPKLFKHIDIIALSEDSNPGSANAFKYGGVFCGIVALILDFLKGFVVIYLSRTMLDVNNFLYTFVIIAPILGHAFPIYMHFKNGGKCILVSFGVVTALTPSLLIALMLALTYIIFSCIVIVNPHALRSIVTFGMWIVELIIFTILKGLPISILVGCVLIALLVIERHIKSLKESDNKEIHFVFGKN